MIRKIKWPNEVIVININGYLIKIFEFVAILTTKI